MSANWSRRQFLGATAAAAGSLAAGPAWSQPARKPNVVLLIIDTLRADALGCYGSAVGASEELDAIAEKSAQFMFTVAPSSWTLTSIGSMLTSQYPRTLGLYDSTDYLQDRAPLLAQQLKAAGYRTMGTTANAMINSVAGFDRGFDAYIDAIINWEEKDKPRTKDSRTTYAEALDLAREKGPEPGYLQINIMEPHEYYRGSGKLTRAEFDDLYPEVTGSAHRREYFQSVRQTSIDTQAFIDELTATAHWDDTLFIILGDHGEGLNDHPRVWQSNSHGKLLYGSHVYVPMLWYHPGGSITPGQVHQPSRLLDVAPTLLEYLGVEPLPQTAGRSLLPLLQGDYSEVLVPEFIVSETYSQSFDKIACFSTAWQFLHHRDFHAGCREFELQRNGAYVNGKHTDLSERHPDIAARMARYIERWEAEHPKTEAVKVRDVSDIGNRQEELEALGYL